MIEKKCLWLPIIMMMFLASLAMVSVPVTSQEEYPVTFDLQYYYQPDGYVPGVEVDGYVMVDVYIDASALQDESSEGMMGWGIKVTVDPTVLTPAGVVAGSTGYFLYDWCVAHWGAGPIPPPEHTIDFLSSYKTDYVTGSSYIIPAPPYGAGGTGLMCTLYFISKSETAYSPITIIEGSPQYLNGSRPGANYIHGHYNQPPMYHNLKVESTPIDGINFNINTTTYTTNATVELEEGSYTVTMPSTCWNNTDQYNFVEWEDHTTNPVRVVSLTSNMTITATYELAEKTFTLTVNSQPITGINFTVDGITNTTNWFGSLVEGSYTVTMPSTCWNNTDQYIFTHWEDDSTDPERSISLTSNMTITATYEKLLLPIASFTFSPTEPIVAEMVTFNASDSKDPDGTIVSYAWDFGDSASGSSAIVEHTYTAAGTYNVTLTVTDDDELTHTITKSITVKETPPSGIPWELYVAAVGVIAIIIIAIAFYYLRKRGQKPA